MMTMEAQALQAGDEFTPDDGETWVRVKTARSADRGRKTVVVGSDGKERIFKSDAEVIVKV